MKIPGRTEFLLSLLVPGLAMLSPTALAAEARLAKLFTDHMVMQRDTELAVWGFSDPGIPVTVSFAGRQLEAAAGPDGKWSVTFPPLPAGGPHKLELAAQGETVQVIQDVLIGEVWLCSGQSNMAYPMKNMNEPWRETAEADPSIRLLIVERSHDIRPRADLGEMNGWHVADEQSLAPFSAACFLMARNLKQSMDVPFGLITSAWGGSAIEAWISSDGLREHGGFDERLEWVESYGRDPDRALAQFTAAWQDWWRHTTGDETAPWQSGYDTSDWQPAPAQLGNWQLWGGEGMAEYTGMIWYRNDFEIRPGDALEGAVLELGGIDDTDVTWVNGQPVGTMFGWGTARRYELPARSLQVGLNSVTVNVYNSWGSGGLYGPPEAIRLVLADGRIIPLAEGWRINKAPRETGSPPLAPWESITGLTTLYNAMIAPLTGFGLGGAMWYQGESNTGRARQYGSLLEHLAADWRSKFRADLPFIVVQLPNFGPLPLEPSDSGWARLRDAQQKMAAGDPLTGLVVTLDSADRTDLHPPNKRIVGERAAAVARALLQGSGEPADGIVPLGARRDGNRIIVEFDNADNPLRTVGAKSPPGFELCNQDGTCSYVDAAVNDNRVVLDAGKFPQATEVRYAWADAPLINLFGSGGLPVGSFSIEISE